MSIYVKQVVAFCLLLIPFFSFAQQNERGGPFSIGSTITDFPEVTWIQGDPVKAFDPNKIYIIELWATWCGPCKAAIPHLNDLHKKYGDKIIIVGQNVFENDEKKVRKFVDDNSAIMTYPVAYAGGTESDFSKKWIKPAEVNGIPQTFVIQGGRIIWRPHPAQLTEGAIELLINGEFSVQKLKELEKDEFEKIRTLAFDTTRHAEAVAAYDKYMETRPDDDQALFYKGISFERAGKGLEAVQFLEKAYHKNKELGQTAYMYYSILNKLGQHNKIIEAANYDLNRAGANDIFYATGIHYGYDAFVNKADYGGAADYINRIREKTNEPDVLAGLLFLSPAGESLKIENAVFEAGKKYLTFSTLDFSYFSMLASRLHKTLGAKKVNTLAKMSLEREIKEGLPQNRINVLKELIAVLEKGGTPSMEQLEMWAAESAK